MICKDEDVCPCCILRRRKDCGHEPCGAGPDADGEYAVFCLYRVSGVEINDSYFSDVISGYHGIGDLVPWDLLYPLKIWYGFNWLNEVELYE
jgi:hypothetical protein